MSKKRRAAHGDGSVYRRKSDNRCVGSYRDTSGKRRYVYGKTEVEAREKLRLVQAKDIMGIRHIEPNTYTLASYLEYWFEVAGPGLKPSAYATYRRHMRLHIIPQLGNLKLRDLKKAHIQKRVSQMVKEEKAPGTIRTIIGILASALSDAVEWDLIVDHPCKKLKLPRIEKGEPIVLEVEEARALLLAGKDSPIPCILALALGTAMRKGEILGLRWNDINWQDGTIRIKRTLSYLKIDGTYQFVETEPKSKSGIRPITLPGFVIEALKAHRARQNEIKIGAANVWQGKNLVCCTKEGGYYWTHTLHRQFKTLLKVAGLPQDMRFHDLRHSAATLLLAMGVHPKVVQELLGHSNIAITLNVYSAVLPSLQKEAMGQFGDLLDG